MAWPPFRRRIPDSTSPADPARLLAGRYRLEGLMATGTGATVHQAVDMRTGGLVAIKLTPIPQDMSVSTRAEWLARLQREVNIARRLAHPDILAMSDAGIDDSHVWMVTEHVRGHDLRHYTRPSRLLPEPVVLQLGSRIAGALAHAHERGVVHRDLKPSNVLLDLAGGVVKLADFGVAYTAADPITRTGQTLGTPAYMAPELLAGAAASPASDSYALGVLLFELLSGAHPHAADSLGGLLQAMRQGPATLLGAVRPDLPDPVRSLVDTLLAQQAQQRPASLRDWAHQAAALAAVMAKAQESGP